MVTGEINTCSNPVMDKYPIKEEVKKKITPRNFIRQEAPAMSSLHVQTN